MKALILIASLTLFPISSACSVNVAKPTVSPPATVKYYGFRCNENHRAHRLPFAHTLRRGNKELVIQDGYCQAT